MTKTNLRAIRLFSLLGVSCAICLPAQASTPFAGEDFDGGATFTAEGLTGIALPTGSTLSPDSGFPLSGGGVMFDIFGVVNRNQASAGGALVPFGLVDESVEGVFTAPDTPGPAFEADVEGILRSTDTDNVFAVADTDNGANPSGDVSAIWTFDISGFENLSLSIDLAAQGNFEAADTFLFEYSIDGGPAQIAFNPVTDESDSIILQRESTATTPNPGFDGDVAAFHDTLLLGGPFLTNADGDLTTGINGEELAIAFDPADTDLDGSVTVNVGGVDVVARSLQITDSSDPADIEIDIIPEFADFVLIDPLEFSDGTQLTNVLTEFTTPITGTGSTLTLTFTGNTNGGDEFFVFDEILLSGDEVVGGDLTGDFNGDGEVNAADYVILRDSSPDVAGDFADFVNNFGATSAPPVSASAVPEPTTATFAMLLLGFGIAHRRRRIWR